MVTGCREEMQNFKNISGLIRLLLARLNTGLLPRQRDHWCKREGTAQLYDSSFVRIGVTWECEQALGSQQL